MNGNEHRAVGDAASGGAVVNVGGTCAQEQFWLSFGDVMALSGDYFRPGPSASSRDDSHADPGDHVATLFSLARIPGAQGVRPGTRDEIIRALHVMTADEAVVDPRFERGGEYAGFALGHHHEGRDVERRVRDRYLILAATNDDHFVDPGGITHVGPAGADPFGSAPLAYR
ncbi:MAG TPA: hypothetical protein VGV90_08100, partial [Solirubrobacteraceae bacterium]|nr:hypothetical protein [Solirubrobacteraceae bacterium]